MAAQQGATAARRPVISLKKPVVAQNVAPQVPQDEPKVREVVFATEKELLVGLEEAFAHKVAALHAELAASLLYFAGQGVEDAPSKEVKKGLFKIYNDAGYQCLNTTDPHYKSASARINAAAGLYVKLSGLETLKDWVGDIRPRMQVGEVINHLEEFNFTSMSAVLEYIGKAPKRKAKDTSEEGSQEQASDNGVPASQKQEAAGAPQQGDAETGSNKQQAQPSAADRAAMAELSQPSAKASVQGAQQEQRNRRANDNLPADRVFVRGHMKVIVPFEATADEVEAAATFLNMVAQRLKLDSLIGSTH